MTTAWFHCFAGTAGDMTLAALVHAGADEQAVMSILGGLPLDDYALTFERVQRCGVASVTAVVAVHGHGGHGHLHRPYGDIVRLLEDADLPTRVRARSLRTFAALAAAEATVHGVDIDAVEFHEVGSVDAIVDIVGACAALEVLDVDRVVCSPITVGQGTVATAHGRLPAPSPAVAGLLASRRVPTRGIDDHRELATPTGVALMVALADAFGPLPALEVAGVGYGAGSIDIAGRPNVVQVLIGEERVSSVAPLSGQPLQWFEANVDDVTGEVIAHTIAALLAAGAHDAWATPIVMKKGRPAFTVHALCDPASGPSIAGVLVAETGTLGLRGGVVERWPQARHETFVEVGGHPVRVKLGAGRVKVEHDDAAAVAAATARPLREVLEAAAAAARQSAGDPLSGP